MTSIELVTLGEVADLQWGDTSVTKKSYVLTGGKYPAYSASGQDGFLPYFDYDRTGVILSAIGANAGKTWLATGKWSCIKNTIRFFSKDESVADTRYLYWATQSHATFPLRGSAQPFISQGDAREVAISLPPIPEQRAIAATLGALDDKIESNRRAIALTDDLVRARFDAYFDLDQVAVGVSIAGLMDVNLKRKLTRGTRATYIGMSSLPEFSPEILDWEKREFGSGQKFENGDVLMARITPCLENGKTAIVDMLEDGEVGWGSTEFVVLSPKGPISTPWIYALVRHDLVREWAIRRMTGTSGRQRFQADGFGNYRIAEPDQRSLEEFNSFAVPLFDRMTQLRDETKRLISLRDALLPELLSGRVSVLAEEGQA